MKKIFVILGLAVFMMSACGQKEETVEVSYQTERVRETDSGHTDQDTEQDHDGQQNADPASSTGKTKKYPIQDIIDDDAFDDIIEGRVIPVILLYGQGGEAGYVTSDTDDAEVINDFVEGFREVTIKEVITDPDKMGYVMDGGEDIVFGLPDGSQVNIVLDGQRIHTDNAIYELDNKDKLTEACHMMSEVAYMNEFGGPADNYIAILRGGSGEQTYQTYVYDIKQGYEYVIVESTTVSWGATEWNHVVKKCGVVSTKEEVVKKAEAYGSAEFMTLPGYNGVYTIEEFTDS